MLTDLSTGSARTTQTNDVGRYVFTQVPPGTYSVTVTKEGFSQTRISDQSVAVGLTLTVNVQLKVGASSQTVEVTYTPGAELKTMNSTYLDRRVGGANTWDNNRLGVANPSAHRNRFGSLGGPLTPSFWGGRTYFFANYEGLRYPFNTTIEREVPSALLRQGIVQINNSGTVGVRVHF